MKHGTVTAALVAICLLFLAACGGGGGGSEGGSDDPGEANSLILGDIIFYEGGQGYVATTSCRGFVCTITYEGESQTVNLRNLDPSGPIPDIREQRTRNGVNVARGRVTDRGVTLDTYMAFGEWNIGTPGAASTRRIGFSLRAAIPLSMGYTIRTNPVSGLATWNGAMVGRTYSSRALGNAVVGDARLVADFAGRDVDVDLYNIAERGTGRRHNSMSWSNLPMRSGHFSGRGIEGRFFGPENEEAGGVFDRDSIIGAFSVRRPTR